MKEIPLHLDRTLSYTLYGTVSGRKNLIAKNFHGCRESFHYQCIKNKRMLFCCKVNGEDTIDITRNVIKFMNIVEDKLKIKSEFHVTNKKNIIYIKFHEFWMKQAMRKSLFTALLKTSQYFREDVAKSTGFEAEFNNAIEKIYYLKETKKALKLFLSGRTKYTGNICGWYNAFYPYCRSWRPEPEILKKLLVEDKS